MEAKQRNVIYFYWKKYFRNIFYYSSDQYLHADYCKMVLIALKSVLDFNKRIFSLS